MLNERSVYQLKVIIKDISPPIWRRLLLHSSATFWELHIAIQDSFGWTDSHLHQFFIGSAWDRNAVRICLPNPEDDIFGEEREPLDESKTHLADFISDVKQKISYVYDFGDNWEHSLILEKILPFDSEEANPQVMAGKRTCPWEDSGGPGGYEHKIEVLKNETHEDFEEIADWVGVDSFDDLDLDSFDPNDVIFRNPTTELRGIQKGFEQAYS